jgi:hypothetical protein
MSVFVDGVTTCTGTNEAEGDVWNTYDVFGVTVVIVVVAVVVVVGFRINDGVVRMTFG